MALGCGTAAGSSGTGPASDISASGDGDSGGSTSSDSGSQTDGAADVASGDGQGTPGCKTLKQNFGLNSAADIDKLKGVCVIEGDLYITGTTLSDLSGLSSLERIDGQLSIDKNSALTSLDGLHNLAKVGGISIVDNPALSSVAGLSGLAETGGLSIQSNPVLANLDGLQLTRLSPGGMHLKYNPALASVAGLSALEQIDGDLELDGTALKSLAGLEKLQTIGKGLHLDPSLTSLAGLSGLVSVGGAVAVYNPSKSLLENLDGLSKLQSVGGEFWLAYDNSNLVTAHLDSLESVGGGLFVNAKKLTSLRANNLTKLGGQLDITHSPLLTSVEMKKLTGAKKLWVSENKTLASLRLDSLLAVGTILVGYDPLLTDLVMGAPLAVTGDVSFQLVGMSDFSGLAGLNTISGKLLVEYNDQLSSLKGLEQLAGVGGFLVFNGNQKLTQLTGLTSLKTVGAYVKITSTQLVSLDGLGQLTTVGESLVIASNSKLTDIKGLSALASVGKTVEIYTNAKLPHCQALALAAQVGKPCTSCSANGKGTCL